MGKQQDEMNELISSTEKEEKDDPVNPKGVGLKRSEHEYIEGEADKLGVSGHALRVYFMRYAITQHKAGKLKVETRKETALEMPETD